MTKKLTVVAKPNKKENRIIYHNTATNTMTVEIAAPPDKNKANKELIKFLSKELKKKIRIINGLRSKEKILEIID
ncbi:DUF167 domain-containing protein [Candidatus Woesearchaeota archaeon]|nr:DUF167 domain-containing protein [Candidatus Woesearchaeota archaeon]